MNREETVQLIKQELSKHFGKTCPYVKRPVFCQERAGCTQCAIYYEEMEIAY